MMIRVQMLRPYRALLAMAAIVAICICLTGRDLVAQTVNLGDDVARPIAGAGHDYIKGLSETVDPANGTLMIKIDLPVPASRGFTIPFSVTYNSGEVFRFTSYMPGCGGFDAAPCSSTAALPRVLNGWSDTFPYTETSDSIVPLPPYSPTNQTNGPPTSYCGTSSSYNFYDPLGETHMLGLAGISGVQGSQNYETSYACSNVTYNTTSCSGSGENGFYFCEGGVPYDAVASGGDDEVSAKADLCTGYYFAGSSSNPPSDCSSGQPSFTVTDKHGTVYSFPQGTGGGLTLEFPTQIEDRNGNIAQVSASYDTGAPLAITDTAGRSVISVSQSTGGNPPYATSYAIGGLTFTPTYTTTNASFSEVANQDYQEIDAPTIGTLSCSATFSVDQSALQVLQTLTLPNGQAYTFKYDPKWGLVNEIDYPDGGSVQYTWKLSDTPSELATFAALQNSGEFPPVSGACNYHYKTPVVATRTVYYGPNSTQEAQYQTFSYNTNWNPVTATSPVACPPSGVTGCGDRTWYSKQTTVATKDVITGQTATTTYGYGYVYQPLQPDSQGQMPAQLAVESSIAYGDWNGATVETVGKTWADQFEMTSETTTLASLPSFQTNYTYVAGFPEQLIEKDEYDFGQAPPSSPPSRKTSYSYYRFDEINQVVVHDGSGNRVAETDAYYDGQAAVGPASTAAPVSSGVSGLATGTHDEANYGTASALPRGNPTKVLRWSDNSAEPIITSTYDETGQALSRTDACGNSTCSDMSSGASHTTAYSYADSPSGGNSPGASNAYLTKITYPTVNGVTATESFTYNYPSGLLTSATDKNNQTTQYTYADSLNRLTQTTYPDTGTVSITYNDSIPSIGMSTLQSAGQSITKVTVMDGLGHPIQTQLTSDPDGADYVNSCYDGMGNVYQQTNPFRSPSPTTLCTAAPAITSLYDVLARKTKETEQDGTNRYWCYDDTLSAANGSSSCHARLGAASAQAGSITGPWTDFTDENGNQWQRVSDAFGRLTQVVEPNGTSQTGSMETDYSYDVRDDLVSVAQWGGSHGGSNAVSRTFSYYDGLPELEVATNPEAGAVQYSYDANGNVSSKTDARGVTTGYQ